jgi:hypothetical protein
MRCASLSLISGIDLGGGGGSNPQFVYEIE